MKNRRTALILSFIYCGLGQIYTKQIAKGISFASIYTILIVLFIMPNPSGILHNLNLSIIFIMWSMGMADAYLYPQTILARRWRRMLMASVMFTVVSCAIVLIVILQVTTLSPPNKQLAQSIITPSKDSGAKVETRKLANSSDLFDTDTSTISSNLDVSLADPDRSDPPFIQEPRILPHGDEENVTIAAYSLHPTIAEPGATIIVSYTISASKAMSVALGFSIQRAGATTWIGDSDNDKVVDMETNGGSYTRRFVLPSTLRPGKYDVAWGIWDPEFTTPYDGRMSTSALTVIATATADDQPEPIPPDRVADAIKVDR